MKPARLIVLETEGWADLDAASIAAFEGLLAKLRAAGVEIWRRADHPLIEGFERALSQAKAITADICAFEQRAGLQHLAETAADRVSPRLFTRLQHGTKVDFVGWSSRRTRTKGRLAKRRDVLTNTGRALAGLARAGHGQTAADRQPRGRSFPTTNLQ